MNALELSSSNECKALFMRKHFRFFLKIFLLSSFLIGGGIMCKNLFPAYNVFLLNMTFHRKITFITGYVMIDIL